MNSDVIYLNKINEVYFQLELNRSQAMELKETLSFYANNYKYHPQFKAGFWNGKICSFNTKDSLLPIGLLPQLIEFCKQFNYPFVFNFDRVEAFGAPLTEDKFDRFIDAVFPADGPIYPRHYQQDAIYKALSNKRGVLQLATGAGKSVIQYAMIRYLMAMGENILLVVPTVSLVEQMFSDFREYGWSNAQDNCNLIYAGKTFDPTKKVTISTWQSIYNKSPAFFKNFTALMIDECHLSSAQGIQTISKNCSRAHYRLGLTGTMPKDDASKFTILGYLGPILYSLDSKTLIDAGVLSQIEIRNVLARYPEPMCNRREDYATEQRDVFNYAPRNKILDHVINNIQDKENILILVQRIEHLKAVRDYLVDNHQKYTVHEYHGESKASDRENIRHLMELSENTIIVGSYQTMSTGINIKRLHHIVFFASYKSEIKILQSIGRGLRTHETKSKMVLWDIVDDLRYQHNKSLVKNYSYNHWEKYRLAYYEEQRFPYTNEQIKLS